MNKGKLSLFGLLAAGGLAAILFPTVMEELEKAKGFISQKITNFKVGGITLGDDQKLKARFLTSVEIENKNSIGFPIQNLQVKLFYKTPNGEVVEVASTTPKFETILIVGGSEKSPGKTKISDIELLVNTNSIPGLLNGLFQFAKGFEFQVQANLKVYGIELSSLTPYKL